MKRRDFLPLSGAALLWDPRPARAAETLAVHYRKPPPYEALRPAIGEGSAAMPDPPSGAPAPAGSKRFRDITAAVLASDQLAKGVPYWLARLDPASGIDLYGNQGIAAADLDGDGRDEIYVCQPAGLPNRLFRWTGDQRLEDISAASGLDLLDDTTCALFLDLRNTGRQDAILLRPSGPELFLNDGQGRFTHRPAAFVFARPPQGGFTGMAAADYDRDGKLDVYLCCYSFFQSEAQYQYPSPYHDARNGPPNFLFRNRLNADGTGAFEDVTQATGLDQNNDRFSFAPAWCDYDGSGWPSLYVANDFGRNNLYRNRQGRFTDVAAAAGVEDMGPGMSACWFDDDGDGRPDLYVSNMWTPLGQRVVEEPAFPHRGTAALREAYRRHTKGNSLYRNLGDGRFEDVSAARRVERGRWAWSADAADFDNDGAPELYVTCGMLTGPRQPDLMSFFWRQVVAKSNANAAPSAAYEAGWNAINQFIREGHSWSGHEPNLFYVRDGRAYRDASAESGLDIAADSRAFAITDFDNDGCLDIAVKSRLAPQLALFENRRGQARARIGFELRGVQSNRDGIGARVEVAGQAKWVNAGSGYLSQHTKRLYFGLKAEAPVRAVIVWPSGQRQTLDGLEPGALYRVTEGEAPAQRVLDFAAAKPLPFTGRAPVVDNTPRLHDTWFVEPIPLPEKHSGPALLTLEAAALRAEPDRAAAWALFRRYLFEYRAPSLELPLFLLLDAGGRARKIYATAPEAEQVRADLARLAAPVAPPYSGRRLGVAQRDHYKLGAALLWSGYDAAALPYLEASVARQPENARMWMLIGRAHLRLARLSEAEAALRKATGFDPRLADAWNELGGVAAARGDRVLALEHYQRALALQDDLLYAHLNAGQALEGLARLPEAERHFRRARALDPQSPDAANALGLVLAKQGQTVEAKTLLQEAIRLKPDFAAAVNNLGVLYVQQAQMNDAVAAFRYGIQQSPKEEILYVNLARIYLQSGEREKARQLMRELLEAVPGSVVAAKALREIGQ